MGCVTREVIQRFRKFGLDGRGNSFGKHCSPVIAQVLQLVGEALTGDHALFVQPLFLQLKFF